MIQYEINQDILPPASRLSDSRAKDVLRAVARYLKIRGSCFVSIAFVDHQTMRRLNRDYRGEDHVTDVLSFGVLSSAGKEGGRGESKDLGELLLAWPYVKIQAKKFGRSTQDEISLLLVHGLLHLSGHDHKKKNEAQKMFAAQDQIIKIL